MNSYNTTVICIDIQEKLVNILDKYKESVCLNIYKLMKTASILGLDTIITEQYPKGLGSTIDKIKSIQDFKTIEKTTFSALKTPEFKNEFDKLQNKNVIIFGIEAHICVYQTVIDLLKENYNVYVVLDCSFSRKKLDFKTSIELMKSFGAKITTLETVLFDLIKSSKHPDFKEIQALIK